MKKWLKENLEKATEEQLRKLFLVAVQIPKNKNNNA